MKVWHHFIYARLPPTMHLSEVTKEQAVLLYGIQKGLKINVGRWIQSNISHTIRQGSRGIPHPTLPTELITSYGIDTTGSKVLQPKGSLNQRAIECIITQELRQEATRANSSCARALRLARLTQTRATIANLTRAVEHHVAQLQL